MLVREYMTANPIRVHPESDPLAALGLCKSARIRRLPVVDAEDHIVGVVTRNMLEQFLAKAPSPGVMKRQHSIDQVMVSPALTVSPDYPLEEAARLMVANKIGSLPVVDHGKLIGIITETDIFKQLVEILGGQVKALRLTVDVPDTPGALAKVINAVAALHGNICSVVLTPGTDPGTRSATLWIVEIDRDTLTAAILALPDVRLVRVWSTPDTE
ncbi:MAG: CBS domain-containing protein [Chloroflexi bacterium]|jgi:acetoin utilization protein AcuB|nr:CBS domain-containing protein [Chloroflexota bacterium]